MTLSFATGKQFHVPVRCAIRTARGAAARYFSSSTTTYTDGGWEGTLHTVRFTGLAGDGSTRYFYQCDNSSEFSFLSSPPPSAFPLTIAAVADMGSKCSGEHGGCPNKTFAALEAGAAKGDFGLLIHAGDIAYSSGNQNIWDTYGREMQGIASKLPYAVAVGNHESHYNFSAYRHRFDMPMEEHENLWWSFDHGGVHVLAYSTEHDYSPDSPQLRFIEKDLADANARRDVTPWVVAMGHRPFYCSTSDAYDCEENGPTKLAPALEGLFVKHGVDIGLYGHLHNYERAWPVVNGSVTQRNYKNPSAPVHVVIGASGDNEGLTSDFVQPQPDWSAVRAAVLGFARMRFFNASTMHFEWVAAETGEVFDNFTLTKHNPSARPKAVNHFTASA